MLMPQNCSAPTCSKIDSSKYIFDESSRVYRREGSDLRHYSDGDSEEQSLYAIVSGAFDLAIGSEELASHITGWVSYYHLSSQRCDLLRPITDLLRGDVLEVGSGCGAITRFLGETSDFVTAVEGSLRRAQITSQRCRNLDNVSVLCDNFRDLALNRRFDAIVCVGSLEYCRWFFPGTASLERMLDRLGQHLKPEGYLIIAIENRLGLRYFAGAPEDHSGVPYQGLHDQYGPNTAITLGRGEWERCLGERGFELATCLYPFPSYKHPELIVSREAFTDPHFDLGALLRHHSRRDQGRPYRPALSEQLVWPVLLRNGLGEDLAPSFLLICRKRPATSTFPRRALAYWYSTCRRRAYCKETRFEYQRNELVVRRHKLYPEAVADSSIRQIFPQCAPYFAGRVYSDHILELLNSPGWTVRDLAEWARPWLLYLMAYASHEESGPHLPAEFVDHGPHNLIHNEDGGFQVFDQEYAAARPIPVSFVVFRSLLGCLTRVESCAQPSESTPTAILALTLEVMRQLGLSSVAEDQLVAQEAALQSAVTGMEQDQWIENMAMIQLRVRGTQSETQIERVCQLFWRFAEDPYFTESQSVRTLYSARQGRQSISLVIPPLRRNPVELRLDIANCTGLARLFSIGLLDKDKDLIWAWNGTLEHLQLCECFNLKFRADDGEGVLGEFATNDPILLLAVSVESLSKLASGGTLKLDLTWLCSPGF